MSQSLAGGTTKTGHNSKLDLKLLQIPQLAAIIKVLQ